MKKTTQVVIIGAGNMGQAIAHILRQTPRVSVELWDVLPGKVKDQKRLEELLPQASVVFICVQTGALSAALGACRELVPRGAIVVSISKGIEPSTDRTVDQLLHESLPKNEYALLLGPMLAAEISAGMGASAVIATASAKTYRRLADLFAPSDLKIVHWKRPRDAAYASIMKNVYSLAMGMAEGLEWGNNQKGRLAAEALREMPQVIKALKGDPAVVWAPAGAADFLATAFSPHSRNRRAGEQLIRTGEHDMYAESLASLASLVRLLNQKTKPFPLLHGVWQVVKKVSPHDGISTRKRLAAQYLVV